MAVVLGVVTLYMAYLGVHVTLHPTEEPRKRRWYKIQFWVCGGVAVLLIAWQTGRNAQTESAIRRQLADIERNTKTPPTVQTTVNVPPAQIITGDEAEKAKRAAAREGLAAFIPEADMLYAAPCTVELSPAPLGVEAACKKKKDAFDKKVENYMRTNRAYIDSSYLVRFKNDGELRNFEYRTLEDLLKELK